MVVGCISEEGRGSFIVQYEDEEVVVERSGLSNTSYFPHYGDWVSLKIQELKEGVVVSEVKPLRSKTVTATVEYFNGKYM